MPLRWWLTSLRLISNHSRMLWWTTVRNGRRSWQISSMRMPEPKWASEKLACGWFGYGTLRHLTDVRVDDGPFVPCCECYQYRCPCHCCLREKAQEPTPWVLWHQYEDLPFRNQGYGCAESKNSLAGAVPKGWWRDGKQNQTHWRQIRQAPGVWGMSITSTGKIWKYAFLHLPPSVFVSGLFLLTLWLLLQVVPSDEELQRKAQMRPQMETFRETLVEAEMRISNWEGFYLNETLWMILPSFPCVSFWWDSMTLVQGSPVTIVSHGVLNVRASRPHWTVLNFF